MALSENKPAEETERDSKETEIVDVDLEIKHPLHNSWSLWFSENDRQKGWQENLKKVASFSTVEDFWSLYNHIKSASELKAGWDYSLFKEGIQPMWEDDANKAGGRWLVTLEKKQRDDVDECWLEIMLCMIGESFQENGDLVNGAVVNVRRGVSRIGLWTGNFDPAKSHVITQIGRKLKERLNLGSRHTIQYQLHKDTQTKTGSTAKSMFSL